MAAVEAGAEAVGRAVAGIAGVWIANYNSPEQTIVSGSRAGIEQALPRLKEQGLRARPVAVACAFHSPLLERAPGLFAESLAAVPLQPPAIPVYANLNAAPHASDPDEIRRAPGPPGRARNVALDSTRAAGILRTRLRGAMEVLHSL